MQTKKYLIITILGITLIMVSACDIKKYYSPGASSCPSASVMKLRDAMRELWALHVIWTREYIVAAVAGTPDVKDVTERLLRNQDDIGNAVASYYGKDAGHALAKLLREHILLGAEVVMDAKAGDQAKLADADKRWHANAQELAKFLSDANPHWPFKALVDMFYEHLRLTTEEAVAHIKKQWQQDIKAFDSVFAQIMIMADDLSDGIIKQFPDKF